MDRPPRSVVERPEAPSVGEAGRALHAVGGLAVLAAWLAWVAGEPAVHAGAAVEQRARAAPGAAALHTNAPARPVGNTAAGPAWQPGPVVFADDFEGGDLGRWDDRDGNLPPQVRITTDPEHVHAGRHAVEITAAPGRGTGGDLLKWFPPGYDRLHARWYIQFASDYDQGNLHHTGGALIGARDRNYVGRSGTKPNGDDWFSTSLEPWRDWGRVAPPGWLYLYTYWVDMEPDPSGPYYGNPFVPDDLVPLERNRWYSLELMVQVNTIGRADGVQEFWLDGEPMGRFEGIRWRTVGSLKLDCLWLLLYIHDNQKENKVWFDDVILSTSYIGPMPPASNATPTDASPSATATATAPPTTSATPSTPTSDAATTPAGTATPSATATFADRAHLPFANAHAP